MPQNKLLITREEFCSIMVKIEAQRKTDEAFSEALHLVCDGFPAYGANNQFEEALMQLLKITCDDQGDWIGHWLFESDCKGFQWWDADNNEHEVETHEDLYDLLRLNAGSRFVTDRMASPMTPAQFKGKMKRASKLQDQDARHKRMDELMCRQLKGLGFEEGVMLFEAIDKWYA